jgi:hypothetical protein
LVSSLPTTHYKLLISKNVPHTVTCVEVRDGHVHFIGPTSPGKPPEYSVELTPHRGDVNAAIRAALEERLHGPDAASLTGRSAPPEIKGI